MFSARRILSKVALSATILSLAITPDISSACTHWPVTVFASNHMAEKCRLARANPRKFLADVKAQRLNDDELHEYLVAFDQGNYGCRENKRMAFRIANAMLPDRLTVSSDFNALQAITRLAPKNFDPQRIRNANGLVWLLGSGEGETPVGWDKNETREFLFTPLNWNLALRNFADRKGRDEIVFAAATDPTSPMFELEYAALLGKETKDKTRQLLFAKLLVDPRLGEPRYDDAAKLLDWYSPYIDYDLTSDEVSQAKSIWTRLAQHRLGSLDPDIKASGRAFFNHGIPGLDPNLVLESKILSDPEIVRMAEWPKSLPEMRNVQRMVTPNDYPSRALRKLEAGRTELAVLFRLDGNSEGLVVTKSSGYEALDQAAVRFIERRIRPRMESLKLDNFQGKRVLVPFPSVEWRIATPDSNFGGGTFLENGRLIVTFKQEYRHDSCGQFSGVS